MSNKEFQELHEEELKTKKEEMNEKKEEATDSSEIKAIENPTGFKIVIREFKKDKLATFCFLFLVVLILTVFITSFLLPKELYTKVDIFKKYAKPSFDSLWLIFGRGPGGTPILPYLLVGARNSIAIGVTITILTTVIGVSVGLIAGFYGGKVDTFIMRIVDFIGTLPTLMLIIVIASIWPRFDIKIFIITMTIFYWIGTARLVRAKALSEAKRDYISASKTMGTSDIKIMLGGILPNISSIIIVDSILALAGNIGIETSLTFLGFGLPLTTPSIGTLISYATKPEIIQYKLYVWLPAAIFLLILMLSINYVGQALKRASDARQRLG